MGKPWQAVNTKDVLKTVRTDRCIFCCGRPPASFPGTMMEILGPRYAGVPKSAFHANQNKPQSGVLHPWLRTPSLAIPPQCWSCAPGSRRHNICRFFSYSTSDNGSTRRHRVPLPTARAYRHGMELQESDKDLLQLPAMDEEYSLCCTQIVPALTKSSLTSLLCCNMLLGQGCPYYKTVHALNAANAQLCTTA